MPKNKFDVTTIGSATQDIYVFSKQFHVQEDPRRSSGLAEFFSFGTKIELDDIFFEVGGGATNAAYTFKNQGLRTACVARIGDDGAGKDVRDSLKKHGISTSRLIVDKKRRTGRGVVFLGRSGERTILVYRGAAQEYSPKDITQAAVRDSAWLYITSLGGAIGTLRKVYSLAGKYKKDVCINPGKQEIEQHTSAMRRLVRETGILSLNREEAAHLSGRAYGNIKGIIRALRSDTDAIIIVTEGKKGSYILVDNQVWHVIITPVSGVDTTGAGDAFGSGFLSGFINSNGDVAKSIALAVDNSGSVIQEMGAKHGLVKKGTRRKRIKHTIKKFNI